MYNTTQNVVFILSKLSCVYRFPKREMCPVVELNKIVIFVLFIFPIFKTTFCNVRNICHFPRVDVCCICILLPSVGSPWVQREGLPSPLSVTTPCSSRVSLQWESYLPSSGMASERKVSSALEIPQLPTVLLLLRSPGLTTTAPGIHTRCALCAIGEEKSI